MVSLSTVLFSRGLVVIFLHDHVTGSVFSVRSFLLLVELFFKTRVFMSGSPQISGNLARKNHSPQLGLGACPAPWRILWLSHFTEELEAYKLLLR